jgi:hypothetical protein
MSLNENYYDCDASFDCSYYLDHGIELPHDDKGYDMKLNHSEMMGYVNSFAGSCDENNSNLLSLTPKPLKRCSTDDYYPVEYNNLLSSMEHSDMELCRSTENELELLREISAAEDALLSTSGNSIYGVDIDMVEYLLTQRTGGLEQYLLKNMEKKERPEDVEWYGQELMEKSFNYSSPQTQNVADEFVKGIGEKRNAWDQDHSSSSDEQTRKRRLCRHFLKGHCKRGNACDFLHDKSIFCPNSQKVFLGGLPAHITEVTLRQRLAEQGYEVINKPKVLRGFTPQVCMSSVEEAQRLIEKRNILIDGTLVDVRAYEAFAKCDVEKIQPDEIKRSVFLGGLSRGTTSLMIKDDLEKMNVTVVNRPLVKTGFAPKVTLQTVEECEMLINLKKVRVNDTMVDVRPYINNKSPFRSYKKN